MAKPWMDLARGVFPALLRNASSLSDSVMSTIQIHENAGLPKSSIGADFWRKDLAWT
jgi:hypothetical protein